MIDLKSLQTEREKIEQQIAAIREARTKHVESLISERQKLVDSVSKITGTPGKPELVVADYAVIENTFNKPIAALKEQLRVAKGKESAALVPGLEDELEIAQGELEKVRFEANAILSAAEGKVKTIEGKINLALTMKEKAEKPGERIRFEAKSGRIEKEHGDFKKRLIDSILSY